MKADDVWNALRAVLDPELGIGVVDLGLVYCVEVVDDQVEVVMTMTSAACPLGEQMARDVETAVRRLSPGPLKVLVRLVFDPPWHPGRMTDAARSRLGWPG
jgi:metal-sulfur cluster biosynthetic enzyme